MNINNSSISQKKESKSLVLSKQIKISSRLNPKITDTFSDKQSRNPFVTYYKNGQIPCRLVHGSVSHKIEWTVDVNSLLLSPLLIIFSEGLRETTHPYNFLAKKGFQELLQIPDAENQIFDVLPKLILPLKTALLIKEESVFLATIEAVLHVSRLVGYVLNRHLKFLLPPISKRLTSKKNRDEIMSFLMELEQNGGKDAATIVKLKVPTYNSPLG